MADHHNRPNQPERRYAEGAFEPPQSIGHGQSPSAAAHSRNSNGIAAFRPLALLSRSETDGVTRHALSQVGSR
jgi:hypothetical protein